MHAPNHGRQVIVTAGNDTHVGWLALARQKREGETGLVLLTPGRVLPVRSDSRMQVL